MQWKNVRYSTRGLFIGLALGILLVISINHPMGILEMMAVAGPFMTLISIHYLIILPIFSLVGFFIGFAIGNIRHRKSLGTGQEHDARSTESVPLLFFVLFLAIFILLPIDILRFPLIDPLHTNEPVESIDIFTWSQKLYRHGFPFSPFIFFPLAFLLAKICKLIIERKAGALKLLGLV